MRVATIFLRRCGSNCPYHRPGITEDGVCRHPTQMNKTGKFRDIHYYDFAGDMPTRFPGFCELEYMTASDGSKIID